eukprot:Nk52_evm75s1810 gene=Nk52_evmTU75s1810
MLRSLGSVVRGATVVARGVGTTSGTRSFVAWPTFSNIKSIGVGGKSTAGNNIMRPLGFRFYGGSVGGGDDDEKSDGKRAKKGSKDKSATEKTKNGAENAKESKRRSKSGRIVRKRSAGSGFEEVVMETPTILDRERSESAPSMGNDSPAKNEGSSLVEFGVPKLYPEVLALPITRHPIFPGFVKHIEIRSKELAAILQKKIDNAAPYVGTFMYKDDNKTDEIIKDISEVYDVGSFAQIQRITKSENGAFQVLLLAHRRIKINSVIEQDPFMKVKVDNLKNEPFEKNDDLLKATSAAVISTIKDILRLNPLFKEQVHFQALNSQIFDNPGHLADFGAALTSGDSVELQRVLQEVNIQERLNLCLHLLKTELVATKLQEKIGREVEEKISKNQRQYLLQEQLKKIKKELGIEKDDKDTVIEKFRKRVEDLKMEKHIKETIDEELAKLSYLDQNASEFNVTRNYLDWLTSMPWGKFSEENFDISRAREVLNADHYGLEDIKERILEFIAVSKLRGSSQGKILCFIGPPGVGKTSIARSIAESINRKYFRFSVGGMSDVAEIKGHRRTYVGAMPGKIIQCLKKTETENPLILIDEIDKLSASRQGDPASALLELLDPEQNKSFLDHYMDVPVDLSKVLFICTANVSDTIPGPLLDRMELIRVSGYVTEEKVAIAKQYLIPQTAKSTGIEPANVTIHDDAIEGLIKYYCRESGVRNLQKHIEKIFRKSALRIVDKNEKQIEVHQPDLKDFVGQPVFASERMYERTPPGVVMGLAWTAMGGSTLYIEALNTESKSPYSTDMEKDKEREGKAGYQYTGQLGDVMKESARIAYTYAKHFLAEKRPENDFFSKANIHMHVPEGATPKDGPSAGCTITTALLSLALNTPVLQDTAMTGEISLTGKILPVGGIKEKILAAKRSGVKHILLPEPNRKDYDDLQEFIKNDIDVHFISEYDEVFNFVLKG